MVDQKLANKSKERRGEDRRKQDIAVEIDRRKHENRRTQEDRRLKAR
ncbi:MAG: hypothetical protein H8E26_15675 [FCB group bacterium]|nr:hypothetical protein [FCB group bacterium]MBL7028393.1 hypothetical protein [Candidatus Neomarinimicrobiota bacterium]MBL7121262.1 hypothetical protein [Candidatus Neomarinimicrobiota bacterium]